MSPRERLVELAAEVLLTDEELAETRHWIRTRPRSTHAALRRFPPRCHVKPLKPLMSPRALGEVVSYLENGNVTVIEPDNPVRGECKPEDLEVVGYCLPFTPEFVATALGGVS